jgi:hypothetical protein
MRFSCNFTTTTGVCMHSLHTISASKLTLILLFAGAVALVYRNSTCIDQPTQVTLSCNSSQYIVISDETRIYVRERAQPAICKDPRYIRKHCYFRADKTVKKVFAACNTNSSCEISVSKKQFPAIDEVVSACRSHGYSGYAYISVLYMCKKRK